MLQRMMPPYRFLFHKKNDAGDNFFDQKGLTIDKIGRAYTPYNACYTLWVVYYCCIV